MTLTFKSVNPTITRTGAISTEDQALYGIIAAHIAKVQGVDPISRTQLLASAEKKWTDKNPGGTPTPGNSGPALG